MKLLTDAEVDDSGTATDVAIQAEPAPLYKDPMKTDIRDFGTPSEPTHLGQADPKIPEWEEKS